jgi:hypothetical protein
VYAHYEYQLCPGITQLCVQFICNMAGLSTLTFAYLVVQIRLERTRGDFCFNNLGGDDVYETFNPPRSYYNVSAWSNECIIMGIRHGQEREICISMGNKRSWACNIIDIRVLYLSRFDSF